MSGAKHLRLRYYTSVEEATLVKVWREHIDSIASYSENLPIFRDISFGLQQYGVKLNKQEVRRRIANYRNKYLAERSRMEADKEYKSDWRLYPLVNSLFNPSKSPPDVHHQQQILELAEKEIRTQWPDLLPYVRQPMNHLKFERDPDGCAYLEVDPSTAQAQLKPEPFEIKTEMKSFELDEPMADVNLLPRLPLAPANRMLETHSAGVASTFQLPAATPPRRFRGRRSIMPRTGQITKTQIERLRKANDLLEEENLTYLNDLKMKEKQFKILEASFELYLQQQETFLSVLLQRGLK